MQAQAIQAEPVDSLQVQADEKEPGCISLPSTAPQVSTPGTGRLTECCGSGALPKSAVTDSAQVDSDFAVAGQAEKEKEIKVLPLFGK